MRRSLIVAACSVALTASVLAGGPSTAADPRSGLLPDQASARAVLAVAQNVLAEPQPADAVPADPAAPSATLALRDLVVARPDLAPADRAAADRLLARPHLDANTCSAHVCVHHDTNGGDAATGAWSQTTMKVMKAVWAREIGDLGYRAPAPDGTAGGNAKLDVYLKDIGPGLYGYCAPTKSVGGSNRRFTGYCVLDNDYARSQFQAEPKDVLKVTAAHEFFHASQFNYDAREDGWFMEASATWMEEQYADGVNDNRQYLPSGQAHLTRQSLDIFDSFGFNQYGNWPFFQYLSDRFGRRVVHKAWESAQGRKSYSLKAVAAALPKGQSVPEVYAAFAAANTTPTASYDEGNTWPRPVTTDVRLSRTGHELLHPSIDHLANVPVQVVPRKKVKGQRWHLRVHVDGPGRSTDPAATLVVLDSSGGRQELPVKLDRDGVGHRTVPFGRNQVDKVYVVLTNASTRYDCWNSDDTYACSGSPKDDQKRFELDLKVVERS